MLIWILDVVQNALFGFRISEYQRRLISCQFFYKGGMPKLIGEYTAVRAAKGCLTDGWRCVFHVLFSVCGEFRVR